MAPVSQSPCAPTVSPTTITTRNIATDSVTLRVLCECTSSPWKKLLPKPNAASVNAAQTAWEASLAKSVSSPLTVPNQPLANGEATISSCRQNTHSAACHAKRRRAV